MGDYKKAGKKKVEGKKAPVVVYKKAGSSKLYVMRKGRMMSYVNYKKMCAKKLMAKVAKKVSKVRKVRKVRKGGESCNHMQGGDETSEIPGRLTNPSEHFVERKISETKFEDMDNGLYEGGRSLRRQRQQSKLRYRGGNEPELVSVPEHLQVKELMPNGEGFQDLNKLLGGTRRYRRSSRSKQSVRKQSTRSRSRSRSRSRTRKSRK